MVIYIDVLILINLYVTYFEISAVCLLTHRRVNNIRIIIGSAIGAAASLTIFIPQDMTLLLTVIKLALCFVITFAVFGKSKASDFLRALLFLLLVNFVFSGLMLCIWLFAAPMNMLFINGTVYFGIDVLTVLVCTAVSYLLLRAIRLILDKNGRCDRKYKVVISNLGKMCSLCALADSGNGTVITDPVEAYAGFVKTYPKQTDPRMVFLILAIVCILLDVAVRKFKFKWPHELIREHREAVRLAVKEQKNGEKSDT